MPLLLLLFIAVPVFEIYLLINVGQIIGAWWTVGLVILTAIIGTQLLRRQGLATLQRAQHSLQEGGLPAMEVLEGAFLLVGGALLLTPGFVTDAVGFLCLLPFTRRAMVRAFLKRGAVKMAASMHSQQQGPGGYTQQQAPRSSGPAVLDGEYRRED